MTNFDHVSPELFVSISKFRREIKQRLIELYRFSEQEAVGAIYNYRKVFPKLMDNTQASDIASRIKDNPYIVGAERFEEYLDSMQEMTVMLAEAKKMPEPLPNKAAEICPSCKLFKYVGEACTFCGSSEAGLRVTN